MSRGEIDPEMVHDVISLVPRSPCTDPDPRLPPPDKELTRAHSLQRGWSIVVKAMAARYPADLGMAYTAACVRRLRLLKLHLSASPAPAEIALGGE